MVLVNRSEKISPNKKITLISYRYYKNSFKLPIKGFLHILFIQSISSWPDPWLCAELLTRLARIVEKWLPIILISSLAAQSIGF